MVHPAETSTTSEPSSAARPRVAVPDALPDVVRHERKRAVRQGVTRPARQGEPELGAAARRAPGLQPAAVQAGVLEGDRQTQAGAAGGAARAGSARQNRLKTIADCPGCSPTPWSRTVERRRPAVGGQVDR